jgi:hypothetical protein
MRGWTSESVSQVKEDVTTATVACGVDQGMFARDMVHGGVNPEVIISASPHALNFEIRFHPSPASPSAFAPDDRLLSTPFDQVR